MRMTSHPSPRKLIGGSPIPAAVALDLLPPIGAEFVPPAGELPAVPEVTVDEYRNLRTHKHEIRPSWKSVLVRAEP